MNPSNRHGLKRLVLPTVLAAAGTWLLIGCIHTPGFNRVVRGKDVSKKVGDRDSRRPLRLGDATRDDVLRLLGQPQIASSTGRYFVYSWGVVSRYVTYPLCLFMTERLVGERSLVLRFDESGVLRKYELLTAEPNPSPLAASMLPIQLPDDIRTDWHEQQERRMRAATQQARTQPSATRPAAPVPLDSPPVQR